ncbi:hypothetical protein MYCTH_2301118 [Thermothelomyces thermophilus ATCC 42464]|uniref:Homeobox domain-containing protein n=1 Tax=Thermothelomyces thermophilus (strain ATCC 42464 / BCRC 31852 / DSM 1799) TaxID=573729 RepID=G2Q942_THET4|nr:uncharacterized protein MYCTH_2301118 [Thermothelomyces thermophilus ATCC 42464]AEO56334.1 hypothetical protein MYCTH_2301118 [Thermothelomyces thermophilus ATCC 42464]
MSNNFDTVTQSDWQGQYSFLPPGDNTIFSQPYEHVASSTENAESPAQPRTVVAPSEAPKAEGSPLGQRLDPLGLRQTKQPSPIPEQPENQEEQCPSKAPELTHEESTTSTETRDVSLGSNPLSSVSSAPGQGSEAGAPSQSGNEGQPAAVKEEEEEEEVVEDEEMAEGGEGGTEAQPQQPQTAAERTAQRRKMKRFRLTHQQTRFLMSEFAKQPHPDAAHRERLSREIPGLSPRQVQVWFQNRRAKIKRLTADDRERMMKMRAVPEDFDSLSALHSPYGAVHALGTPITSPVDLGGSSYAPLMVDVRRHDGDEHLSPTGLSPAFGNIGFGHSAGLGTPDILSPISPTSTDRYGYPSHLSTTPLSAGPRTSNPFARQASLDSGMQMHNAHSRQQIRPLQPLQLRDTMTRSRSDSLQSPLRSSMSWKGDAIDYTTYQGGNPSSHLGSRQHSIYHQDQVGGSSAGGLGAYESGNYSASAVQSPAHYSGFQSSSLQASQQRNSRLRAASASSLPLGLDLRTQFRSAIGSGGGLPNSTQSPGPRTASTPQLGGVSSGFTGSFPSTPLTAPVDFSLPRSSAAYRTSTTDYSMPQMSAPIAPPNDFSQAFQASMSSPSARTPMRDSFGGGGGGGGGGAGPLGLGPQRQGPGDRSDDYSDPLGMKRKRSFTGPLPATTAGAGAYGSTA